ncbi:MAG: YhcH/YjgK/YiaL family protein [Methanobrevibacter sp.]|jgi:YhcH/YjgK/YiaL family protein|nr:YhcH/YjgK/YiaL family protein [Methanobrevibacter sp.]
MKDLNKIKELCPSAYDFIVNKAEGAAVGKYDLENGVYVSVQEYTTKARSEAKYEAHKKFIDIQMILSGKELIAVSPIEKMTISDEYNEEKDFMLFHHNDECTDYVLEAGEFLILYPQDVHMPGVCVNEKSPVRKIVVKVPVEK